MSLPYIELRTLHTDSLSRNLARHLYTRQMPGTVLVLTERPIIVGSAIRKQWSQLAPRVQRELSSTLNASRLHEYKAILANMRRFRMTIKPSAEAPGHDLYLCTPEELKSLPPECHTVYVTCSVDEVYLNSLADKMPSNALLVRY
ncbi:hypothetical protein GCM10018980_40020 [Streptomyces capoamus]|uniref:Uncharacterized protein n=1 Tax=Streptomyces capoamus TaxID=68183 RepID=A0A919C7A9_9ACTN|nr:hypothetical protein GCM10010501_26170 [Streptomyces libani subsp. rufus]GHG54953.1 hypothetical protein GCM10018980_40020 [Streptomyces capoamus]